MSKRFTDAELAAEYYAMEREYEEAKWVTERGDWRLLDERSWTLKVFATTPSYDEAAA